MNSKKKEILILIIVIILQTLIYVYVGANRGYLHMDEAYSFGLSNYDKVDIQNNEDFFNKWHNKEYYKDYLVVNEDEAGDFKPVYENQVNDVHPPLYYLLLRINMELAKEKFSLWTGIGLNIIIYIFITVFMYLILKELFNNEKYMTIKSAVLAFMSSIIFGSLSNVLFIRMYTLLTLEIIITTYLHIQLLKKKDINFGILIKIGIVVLAGVLTHYYYLIYLIPLYVIFVIKYIKEKQTKKIILYTFTMVLSGLLSLLIFPYSIKHIFFGNRGLDTINNLKNVDIILSSIYTQLENLNFNAFNLLLPLIMIITLIIYINNKISKRDCLKISKEEKQVLIIIAIPSIFFFLITSIISPWKVLRYFVPVCALIFVIVMYCFYKFLQLFFCEKYSNNIIIIFFIIMLLVVPIYMRIDSDLWYRDRIEIERKLEGELNLPTIYLYNSQNSRFLDDILLFSKIDESYVARDIDCTEDNIKKIFEGKNIKNGIIVFINTGQDNEELLNTVKISLNFNSIKHLKKLNSADVYYISN